jgi:hydroxymethylglutaryl-CoA reductase
VIPAFPRNRESIAAEADSRFRESPTDTDTAELNIIMSILSNYVPECIVRAEVNCPVNQLTEKGIEGAEFAQKFVQAITIAEIEPYRAVTHNKGIMNGVDAVVLATGNDFRAVEAGVHAYAARNGTYTSLTGAKVENDIFSFWIELPLALGTVGGLTTLHPLVKWSLELLQNPSAQELMQIVAVAGLAQNFAAVKSLTTTGIQQGHMKMHLMNILNQMEATADEKNQAITHFKDTPVSHSGAVSFIENLRS